MTMSELTEHQKYLRDVLRAAQDACHARRLEEIDAAMAYMRSLKSGGDARHREMDWRHAQARYEDCERTMESARSDFMACNKVILDMLERDGAAS